MRNFSLLLIILCAVSIKVHAVDEIVITAAPYNPPSHSFQPTVDLGTPHTGDRDAQIFKARVKACTDYAAQQKEACYAKKDKIFDAHIEACDSLGTAGAAGGGVLLAVGTAIAIASGPVGWAVFFIVGGGAVAGGGLVAQQEGNYGCRDDANKNKETNTKACNNYKAKIEVEKCSKISHIIQ